MPSCTHKVQFIWYSSRKIERGFLEQNNRWKIYWEIQCSRNDEDYEDIIEAVLADERYISVWAAGSCEGKT